LHLVRRSPKMVDARPGRSRDDDEADAGGPGVSRGDTELPFAASGEQIRQREFATVRRGYDPDQVRSYLTMLAAHVETVERALADAQTRIRQLEDAPPAPSPEPEADAYEQISRRFASVLSSADHEADRVVEQARAEAERIKDEAQSRAEEARIRASQALVNAREESDRMLATLAERRETMLSQLHEMQSRLLDMAQDLEGTNQPTAAALEEEPRPGPSTERIEEPRPVPGPDRDGGSRPVDDIWVVAGAPPSTGEGSSDAEEAPASSDDAGLAGLFDDASGGESGEQTVDLPDLSSIEFDFDESESER
jgi:cell division initiation protein